MTGTEVKNNCTEENFKLSFLFCFCFRFCSQHHSSYLLTGLLLSGIQVTVSKDLIFYNILDILTYTGSTSINSGWQNLTYSLLASAATWRTSTSTWTARKIHEGINDDIWKHHCFPNCDRFIVFCSATTSTSNNLRKVEKKYAPTEPDWDSGYSDG